jgi:hypothetical protein
MAVGSRSRFFRGFIVLMWASAALLVAGVGLSLLVSSLDGHGSLAGNTVLFVFGLILLVLSPVAFIVGVVYWRSQPTNSGEKIT